MPELHQFPIVHVETGYCRCKECGQAFIYNYVIEDETGRQLTNPTCVYCGYNIEVRAVEKKDVTPDDIATVCNKIDELENAKAKRLGIQRPADGGLIQDTELPF
jgi:hypothetical protein